MNSSDTTIKINGVLATPYETVLIYGIECVAFGLKVKPNPFDLPDWFPDIETTIRIIARDYQIDNFKRFMIEENIGKQLVVNGVLLPDTKEYGSVIICNKTIFNDTSRKFVSIEQIEERKKSEADLSFLDDLVKEDKRS